MTSFQNESLRKKLYDYIKNKMNSGELKRGDTINQKELSEELGISRTPFRDCMIQLEAEGFVTIVPCKGVIVRYLTFEEIMDAQEVGAALEGMAYELAFEPVRKSSVEKLRLIVDEVEKRLHDGDVSLCYDKNIAFHETILEKCPNKQIVSTLVKMRERLYDFPRHDLTPVLKWEKLFWQEHRNQIEILNNWTAKEFGEYNRTVHWGIQGKEGYWETLFDVPAGSVKKYFIERAKTS